MIKKALLLFFGFAMVLGTVNGAAAAGEASAATLDDVVSFDLHGDKSTTVEKWRISLAGTVASNQGDALVVYLKSPDRMAVEKGDRAQNLQRLAVTADTTASDSVGKAIATGDILPGQEVQVTFRYSFTNGSPRTAQAETLLSVELRGTALKQKSAATVDTFAKDVLVGTVIAKQGNVLDVYVETGRVFSGDTEYYVQGTHRVTIPSDAAVSDENGKRVALGNVKAFQRVALTAEESLWAQSYPPRYMLQTASKVQVLGEGQKIIAPSELAGLGWVTGTVAAVQKDAGGTNQLVLQPADGSREARLSRQYLVAETGIPAVYNANGGYAAFSSIKQGTQVRIRYEGLVYGEGVTAEIPWYHRIDLVS